MKQSTSRWLLRLAVLPLLCIAVVLWATWGQSAKRLTVENRSGQPIAQLQLTVDGETVTFRDVKPGGEVSAPSAGGRFALEGQLANGTRIRFQGPSPEGTGLLILPDGSITLRPKGKGLGF